MKYKTIKQKFNFLKPELVQLIENYAQETTINVHKVYQLLKLELLNYSNPLKNQLHPTAVHYNMNNIEKIIKDIESSITDLLEIDIERVKLELPDNINKNVRKKKKKKKKKKKNTSAKQAKPAANPPKADDINDMDDLMNDNELALPKEEEVEEGLEQLVNEPDILNTNEQDISKIVNTYPIKPFSLTETEAISIKQLIDNITCINRIYFGGRGLGEYMSGNHHNYFHTCKRKHVPSQCPLCNYSNENRSKLIKDIDLYIISESNTSQTFNDTINELKQKELHDWEIDFTSCHEYKGAVSLYFDHLHSFKYISY